MKYRLRDIISPRKWWLYIWGTVRSRFWGISKTTALGELKSEMLNITAADEFKEQVIWRAIQCEDCLNAGECPHCGCATPAKFLGENDECSQGNWGPMKEKEEWKIFKDSIV